ncbi:hypothetical protein [Empedobacter sp. GD03797]|uniref:hypothetical protein n=1 Tax=Empedobacter sp. GD03797 TaxID=2975382 RepID=UPI002448B290|nr:hypothetical protein [Empedobacter sp. GD03797]MDH1882892.1 hypothetical protein [Empedobacter sp. GD03797]
MNSNNDIWIVQRILRYILALILGGVVFLLISFLDILFIEKISPQSLEILLGNYVMPFIKGFIYTYVVMKISIGQKGRIIMGLISVCFIIFFILGSYYYEIQNLPIFYRLLGNYTTIIGSLLSFIMGCKFLTDKKKLNSTVN